MFICLQPVVATDYTGFSDTLIESNWETRSPGNNFAGADFSTFISTLNSSSLLKYNSYTETHGVVVGTDSIARTVGSDVYDEGQGFFTSGPTRTYQYSSGVEYLTVYAAGPGTDQTQTTPHPGTGYGSGESETRWDIVGGGAEWAWTVIVRYQGFTSAHYTFGSDSSGSYSGETTVSGHGSRPPKGTWINQTTFGTTGQMPSYYYQDIQTTTTAPTGSYISYTIGTITETRATTTNTTIIVPSWEGKQTSMVISSQAFSDDVIYDPDQFYAYDTIYVPEQNADRYEVLWLLSMDLPEEIRDPQPVSDVFWTQADELRMPRFPNQFPVKVLSIYDNSTPNETFGCFVTTSMTDPTHSFTSISYKTRLNSSTTDITEIDWQTSTRTFYDIGSLPMESYTDEFNYQLTEMTTDDAGGQLTTDSTFEELASKTTQSNTYEYSTLPVFVTYSDNKGRQTTTSYFNEFVHTISGGATQTSADYDYIITVSDEYQIPSSGDPVRGGANVNLEGQTIWGSYSNSSSRIYPADIVFGTGAWPGIYPPGNTLFSPTITTGYQIQPLISNDDPIYNGVDANVLISDFGAEFFNLAFAGTDVSIPFQSYYKDATSGETGASSTYEYRFSFGSDYSDAGQVSVTHQFGASSDTESGVMQLIGAGDIIEPELNIQRQNYLAGRVGLHHYINNVVIGGSPAARGFGLGGDTVNFIPGRYDTWDEQGGKGRMDLNWSFEMATDELSGWSGVDCITIGTASLWGNSYLATNAIVFASVVDLGIL